jgi:hypothetical protein
MQCSRKIYDVILPISVSNRANITKFYDFLEVEEFGRVRWTRWARMAPRAVGEASPSTRTRDAALALPDKALFIRMVTNQ